MHRRGLERELAEEMRYHEELLVSDALAEGLTPAEARVAARRRFGNTMYFREASRDSWSFRWLEEAGQDVRFALRSVGRNRVVSLAVVVTLALAIGANTTIFSLINAIVLRPLPVDESERFVQVTRITESGQESASFPLALIELLGRGRRTVSSVAFFDNTRLNIGMDGQAEPAMGKLVSGNFFALTGVRASLGRLIGPEDDVAGVAPVAVISHGFWSRRFGRNPSAIGQVIDLNGAPMTVIGVLPPEFTLSAGVAPDEVWAPLALHPQLGLKDHKEVLAYARIAANATRESAELELTAAYRAVVEDSLNRAGSAGSSAIDARSGADSQTSAKLERKLGEARGAGPRAFSTADRIRTVQSVRIAMQKPDEWIGLAREIGDRLRILLVTSVLVLTIVCANVANLLFARGASRQREMAMRLALGARRSRLIRLLLTEAAVLALAGGALGLVVSRWSSALLLRFLAYEYDSFLVNFRPDARVLLFAATVTTLAVVVFGLAPALRSSRLSLHDTLKSGSAGVRGSGPVLKIARVLVSAQVALSLLLLVTSGIFIRAVRQEISVDPGYERERVLTFWVYPTTLGYEGARELALYERIRERLGATPGVQSASLHRHALGRSGGGGSQACAPPRQPGEVPGIGGMLVGAGFFETLGIPVLAGRGFTTVDIATAAPVMVIGESMALAYFPDGRALGNSLRVVGLNRSFEIIGVVRDIGYRALGQDRAGCQAYIPVAHAPARNLGQMIFIARTVGDPSGVATAVRRAVAEVERNLSLFYFQTLAAEQSGEYADEASLATLTSAFGAVALAFAAIGLFGMLSYAVTSRRAELGLRLALGARPSAVVAGVMREMVRLVFYGVILGVIAAIAIQRLTGSFLFGVEPTDPTAIATAIGVLLLVGGAAAYVPARRASRIDPVNVLRVE
jgi:predicted permease